MLRSLYIHPMLKHGPILMGHHEKALKARNVRVALATDVFNPYGMVAALYTCWPVFTITLNLPPPPGGVLFQRQNIFL